MSESIDERLKKEGEELRRKKNGGYVYPRQGFKNRYEYFVVGTPGITRRDQLADQFAVAMITGTINLIGKGGREVSMQVKAYQLADDMIEEGRK